MRLPQAEEQIREAERTGKTIIAPMLWERHDDEWKR